ncbi:MAG TPA: amino acid ABC transporter permease [Rhodocyclaceae bacterium]|nr:amino acid ABC transporter permease [Rhodocyclaceae bacterium]HMV54795.1 amino acid ABC transporter permease [Rhodocyclaceae bacterium]HMZ83778.1 amino acid ABC transporter permease [Rhodocyclaceae bacterium]HNA04342.1 amino acid ABC transporter permease [Rhodocyclaceae bacterium]HNB78805.1 amino acid ABC transporter permease [Rhodocyclaceae bacterium]
MLETLDPAVVAAALPFLWTGFLFSLKLTLVAAAGGIVFGTLLALARLSSNALLRNAAAAYVNTLRAIPLVMVILWFFLVIPLIIGKPVGAENSALITFTLFEAAYFAEIMRAGIQSVPRGQLAAAHALGLDRLQAMRHVVLPQAFRNMLPVLLTQTIILFQDTSLVHAIGARDLLKAAEISGKNFNRPVEMILFVALIYFGVCFTLSRVVRRLQAHTAVAR